MSAENKKSLKNQSVIRNALSMSTGTLMSRILGFIRDAMIVAFFGRTLSDAFVVAFRLPNLFRRLLGEGSLSVSFIPVYIELKHLKGAEKAKELSSIMMILLMMLTGLLTTLGILFMDSIIEFVVSGKGFQSVEGKVEVTVALGRIMFGYLFLVTNYGLFMAIAQANRRFFVSALAPALFNLVLILFLFLPNSLFAFHGAVLGWGVLVGGVIQLAVVLFELKSRNLLPQLKWHGLSPEAKMVLRKMLPGLLGMGILQIMSVVNVYFASRLGEGTHTYIYYGDRILELPQSLIAISMGAALLPALSSLWANGDDKKAHTELFKYIRVMLFLSIPSAVGLYVLGLPIVEVLFKRGLFTESDSAMTAMVVQIYSLLLIVSSFIKVFVTGFYAKKNTWFPALSSAIILVLHLFIANSLTNALGLKGLVMATVISTSLNMGVLLIGFHKLVSSLSLVELIKLPLRFFPAALVMGGVVHLTYGAMDGFMGHLVALKAVNLFVSIVVGVLVYFGVSSILKIEEALLLKKLIRR